ncbi:MAG: VWA domain-containing protein [Sulfurospirillaceae bacterium]|nr:VWA domain-containing protein [Sulfurospirillaceae bacterium]MDD3462135.1 VWA domain-containing protein [Sulfurospirillaceae bacterium]
MNNFTFEYPAVFLLLIPFVLCAIFCKQRATSFYIPHILNMPLHVKKTRLSAILKWISLTLIVTALASPVIQSESTPKRYSHALMLLMDVSESMVRGALGFGQMGRYENKFDMSKYLASEFILKRENDNVGVIVFGDFAYVASPLTFDHKSASRLLETILPGVAGRKTAMYDALFLSTRLLQKSEAKEKVAILLTDGFNTAGKVPFNVALRAIQSEKIKVYTIGIGREGEYDEAVLRHIAKQSGGDFYKAKDEKTLQLIYEQIDKQEKSLLKSQTIVRYEYLYMYPLSFGFVTLLGYLLMVLKEQE